MRNSCLLIKADRMLQFQCPRLKCLTQGNLLLQVDQIQRVFEVVWRVQSPLQSGALTAQRRLLTSLKRSGQVVHLIRWVFHRAITVAATHDPNKASWTHTLTRWLPLASISEPVNTVTALDSTSTLRTLVQVRTHPVVLKLSIMTDTVDLFF